jgi:hypothetical protein
MIVYGAGIVLVMIFMPEGITGLTRYLAVRSHPAASGTGGCAERSSRR